MQALTSLGQTSAGYDLESGICSTRWKIEAHREKVAAKKLESKSHCAFQLADNESRPRFYCESVQTLTNAPCTQNGLLRHSCKNKLAVPAVERDQSTNADPFHFMLANPGQPDSLEQLFTKCISNW